MAKPQVKLGSAHIVFYIGQYLSDVKHCSIQSWPCGGLSSWLMVPTTRNITAPSTPGVLLSGKYPLWSINCGLVVVCITIDLGKHWFK